MVEPISRETKPEHFSELSGIRTPAERIPLCYSCPKPSAGAQILDMLPYAKQGNTLMTARFFCSDCHPDPFSVMSSALYPHYQVTEQGGGTYRLMRLTREQAIARVKRG